MAEIKKRDWKEIVKESDGEMVFVPDHLMGRVKDLHKKREAFDKQLEQAAKNEIEIGTEMNNIMYEIRKHYDSVGLAQWRKNIGLNANALSEGEFIVNFTDPQ